MISQADLEEQLARPLLSAMGRHLAETRFASLAIPTRLSKALEQAQVYTIENLAGGGIARLARVRGFGRNSVGQLVALLDTLVQTDPSRTTLPLVEQIEGVFSTLQPRMTLILRARLGYDAAPITLDQLAARLAITRERVRQIEVRGLEIVSGRISFLSELGSVVLQLLEGRTEPIYLDLLHLDDSRFSGFDDRLGILEQIIEKYCVGQIHVWSLEGRQIATRASEGDWEELQTTTKHTLALEANRETTESDIMLILSSLADRYQCPELSSTLYQIVKSKLHFGSASGGARVLVGVGRGSRAVVRAVLEEATRPLTLREISAECEKRNGKRLSEMAYRNILQSVGAHVFEKRRYGLAKHSGIASETRGKILLLAERIVKQGPKGFQWHCADLVEEVTRLEPELSQSLDRYTLALILQDSENLQPLGRMIWRLGSPTAIKSEDRRSIADLCVLVLKAARKPLHQKVLAKRVRAMRGLNVSFQPQPNKHMARLKPGYWGLVERDFPFQAQERKRILHKLESVLKRRSKALHASEVAYKIGLKSTVRSHFGTAIFGLAQIDPRFRTGRGNLIGLAAWSELGRHSAQSAIRECARHIDQFATPEELYRAIDKLAERKVRRSAILNSLNTLGYRYDQERHNWENLKSLVEAQKVQ